MSAWKKFIQLVYNVTIDVSILLRILFNIAITFNIIQLKIDKSYNYKLNFKNRIVRHVAVSCVAVIINCDVQAYSHYNYQVK